MSEQKEIAIEGTNYTKFLVFRYDERISKVLQKQTNKSAFVRNCIINTAHVIQNCDTQEICDTDVIHGCDTNMFYKLCRIYFDGFKKYNSETLRTYVNDMIERSFTDTELELITEALKK